MRKKVLSLLICGATIITGGIFSAESVYAYELNSEIIDVIDDKEFKVEDIIEESASNTIIVDSSFQGVDGDKVKGIKVYKTIQEAINEVSQNNTNNINIVVKKGVYKEKITINKPNITLVGESVENTILTYDAAAGTIIPNADGGNGSKTYGTDKCASVIVTKDAKNFSAVNITIENSFDEEASTTITNKQAVALKNEANESMFVNCRFLGNQDTLYAKINKQYYYNCYIEGDVDFIFGGASAVFEKCEIKSLDRVDSSTKGYITAASTLEENKYGFLISNSKLTSNITQDGTVYLGRPWHPSSETKSIVSNVVYKNCEMGAHISAKGWDKMSGHLPEDNALFEYGSTGKGAILSTTRRVLTKEQANEYTTENVLNGWNINNINSKLNELLKLVK
ncbi:MAG: pectinesterase family protein [Clostridium perfringens]|nr:pectinesterase family protein [Clostridium perfringens]